MTPKWCPPRVKHTSVLQTNTPSLILKLANDCLSVDVLLRSRGVSLLLGVLLLLLGVLLWVLVLLLHVAALGRASNDDGAAGLAVAAHTAGNDGANDDQDRDDDDSDDDTNAKADSRAVGVATGAVAAPVVPVERRARAGVGARA